MCVIWQWWQWRQTGFSISRPVTVSTWMFLLEFLKSHTFVPLSIHLSHFIYICSTFYTFVAFSVLWSHFLYICPTFFTFVLFSIHMSHFLQTCRSTVIFAQEMTCYSKQYHCTASFILTSCYFAFRTLVWMIFISR